nr:Protein ZK470.2, isoform c [Haemonchus contortus]
MDQPELSHHVSFHVPEEEHDHLHLRPSAISFRTPNKGGSHSNVPHLLLTQDQAHPSLSRIVSGFFHVEDALRPSTASCGNLEVLISEIISF